MSVSTLRGQVDRLSKEVADLEKKAAEESARAVKEQGRALSAQDAASRTSSASTLKSKLREMQRYQESASRHQQQAAKYLEQTASKRRSLSSYQNQLDRALKDEREKEERGRKRQREEDLRHLRELERSRRSALAAPDHLMSTGPTRSQAPEFPRADAAEFEYDVCLSFAGEERPYVEMVASALRNGGARVFYDRDEVENLWGKNLVEHFDHVYRTASRYCVMFISEAYASKVWTRHERRSALARALEEEGEYVLPARFDDTELPGLLPTVAYIDLREYAPATLAEFVLKKLGLAGATTEGPQAHLAGTDEPPK